MSRTKITGSVLANTAVTAGSYGSSTQIPTFVVDPQGRLTAASSSAPAFTSGTIDNVVIGANTAANGSFTALVASSVTVNGRELAAYSNAAFSQANTAVNNAASASAYANTGIALAQAAFNSANNVAPQIQPAFDRANTASANAASASLYANTAINNAASASTYANAAINNVASASLYANTGINNAASASLYANTGLTLAQAAFNAQNSTATIANTKLSSSGGTISGTLTVSQDLNIGGNVYVSGNTFSVDTTNMNIADPLIYMAQGNSANLNDIGLVGHFTSDHYQHTGIVRDHTDGTWKFFSNVSTEPSTTVNFAEANTVYDSVKVGGLTSTTFLNLPANTTANRPSSPNVGSIRFNTTTSKFEGYSSQWGNLGGGAAISDTPPSNPGSGDLWWNSSDGNTYVYYNSQWIQGTSGGEGLYLPLTGGTVSGNLTYTGTLTGSSNTINFGSGQFYKDANGNIGLSTTSPVYKLDVNGTAGFSSTVTLGAGTANGVLYLNGSKAVTSGSSLTFDGSNLSLIEANGSGAKSILMQGGASAGDYGILSIANGSTIRGRLVADAGTDAFIFDTAGGVSTSYIWKLGSSYSEGMRLDSSGNLLIGASSLPSIAGKLNVYNGSSTGTVASLYRGTQGADSSMVTGFGNPYIQIGETEYKSGSYQTIGFGYVTGSYPPAEIGLVTTNVGGYTLGDLVFATRNVVTNTVVTERMRIDSSGGILVGGSTSYAYTSTAGINFSNGTSDTPGIQFLHKNNKNWGIDSWNSSGTNTDDSLQYLRFVKDINETGGASVVTVSRDGTIGIGGTTPSNVGTGIKFPATQNASSDPNTLDDYEEGTCTLTLQPSSGFTMSSNTTGAKYVKIGNKVTVTGYPSGTVPSSLGSYSNDNVSFSLNISGLPFAIAGGVESRSAPVIGVYAGISVVNGVLSGHGFETTNSIVLYQNKDNGATRSSPTLTVNVSVYVHICFTYFTN